MIALEYPPPFEGGQGRYVYELRNILVKEYRYNVEVFAYGNKTYTEANDKIHRFSTLNLPFIRILGLSRKISKSIKNKFDVYHVHSAPLALFLEKEPLVVTAHTTIFGEGRGVELSRGRRVSDNFISFYYKQLRFFDKRAYDKAEIVIAVNDNIREELKEVYRINEKKIITVYNGVNTKSFYPMNNRESIKKELGLSPKSFIVLYIGRLDARKNVSLLVKAMRLLKNSDTVCLIVGTGSRKAELEELTENLCLQKNVKFLGHVPNINLLKVYNASDTFVLPSVYEGMPLTLLEAMACGIPTIVTNFPGVTNVIINGYNGIILKYATDKCIAENIVNLRENSSLRQYISENAVNTIRDNFTLNTTVERIVDIYKSL